MGELDPSFLSHGASIQLKNSVETARHFSVSDGALISSDRAVVRSPLTVDTRMRHQRDTGYKNMLAPVRDPTHHDVDKSHRGRQVRHPRSPSHPEKKRSKCGCQTRRSQTTPAPYLPRPSPQSPQVQARSSPSPPRSPSPPPALCTSWCMPRSSARVWSSQGHRPSRVMGRHLRVLESLGKSWKSLGKVLEKSWKSLGKVLEKVLESIGIPCLGKVLEKVLESLGKVLESLGKSWKVLENLGKSWKILESLGKS